MSLTSKRLKLALALCLSGSPAFAQETVLGSGVVHSATAAPSGGTSTPFLGSTGLPTSGTLTQRFPIVGSGATYGGGSTATNRSVPIPVDGTIKGVYATLNAAQNTSPTPASVVARINSVNKTLGCSFTATSAPFSCQSAGSDAITAGDLLQWEFSPGTGPWAQLATPLQTISSMFTSTNPNQGVIVGGPSNTSIAGTIAAVWMALGSTYPAGAATQTEVSMSSIMPVPGQITGLYVSTNGPENTVPHVYTLFRNGAATGMTCTPAASSSIGCCVNPTGSGHVGGASGPTCGSTSPVSYAVGDTVSVQVACATVNCQGLSPGVSLIWAPTTPNQTVFGSSWATTTTSPSWTGVSDNFRYTAQAGMLFNVVPQLGASTITFSKLIACIGTGTGAAGSWNFTSQLGATPITIPSNVAGGTVASFGNGQTCPGANSVALPGGGQDTTHSWTAGAGNTLDTTITATGSPAGASIWKIGIAAVVSP